MTPIEDWPADPGHVWAVLGLTVSVQDNWAECPDCNSSAKLKTTPTAGWWYVCGECGSCGSPADAVAAVRKSDDRAVADEWAAMAGYPEISDGSYSEWRSSRRARRVLCDLASSVSDSVLGAQSVRTAAGLPNRKPGDSWGFVRVEKIQGAAAGLSKIGGYKSAVNALLSVTDGASSAALIPAEDGIRQVGSWISGRDCKWRWIGYRKPWWRGGPTVYAPYGFSGVWINHADALKRGGAVVRGRPAEAAALVSYLAESRGGSAAVGRPLCPAGLALAVAGNFQTVDRAGVRKSWKDAAAEALAGLSYSQCAQFLSASGWRGQAPSSWSSAAKSAACLVEKPERYATIVCGNRVFRKLTYGWSDSLTGEVVVNRSVSVTKEVSDGSVLYNLKITGPGKTWTGKCLSRKFRRDPVGVVEYVCGGDVCFSAGAKSLLYRLAGSQLKNDGCDPV